MDVSASFLIAKNVDEAFDARFKAGGSGLRIDRKVQDGLALNAADDGVVGHRIQAAGKRADKQDAVNRAMQLHNRADDLTIHDPGKRVGEFEAFLQSLLARAKPPSRRVLSDEARIRNLLQV